MKRIISLTITLAALFSANSAFACNVPNNASPGIRELVQQDGGWPMSNAQCEFLRQKNLYIDVTSHSTVLSGTSVGWATVRLVDQNNIASNETRVSTYVNSSKIGMDIAQSLTLSALRDCISNLDFEKAAREIASFQKATLKTK